MTSSEPTIVTSSITDPLRQIGRFGGDVQAVMRRAGLGPDTFDKAPAAIPLRAFVALSQTAADCLNRPDFGWLTGSRFDLANLGPVGRAMLSAPNAGSALRLVCDAFASVQAHSELCLRVEGETARLQYRVLDPRIWPRDQDAELTLAAIGRVLWLAKGPDWRPDRLIFEHAAGRTAAAAMLRARQGVDYGGACNEMQFPAAHLSAPMPDSNQGRFRAECAETRRIAHQIAGQSGPEGRVRQLILQRFGAASLDQTDIARALGCSRRSLRRRLAESGTSYSRVLADCRIGVARHRLQHSTQSVASIAEELGYSDPTAFDRAFRRAAGLSPTQFRRQT
ncbi:AraC family transcriptional regulator [Tropicimonas sp. IMCC34043]|uniref:AraC-like transcriptional regulator QhpR n=1 Tax=Tropicimonas sp. IMCC34043 TaxID=2248760 RepID=UPI000E2317E7|nr:AraC family transcriptional regulator [Tropicimonas sp. IMCC34043]